MAALQDQRRVQKPKCKWIYVWDKPNLGQSHFFESKLAARDKSKPVNPEKLNVLDRFIGGSRIHMKDLGMEHTKNLSIPEWMDIFT